MRQRARGIWDMQTLKRLRREFVVSFMMTLRLWLSSLIMRCCAGQTHLYRNCLWGASSMALAPQTFLCGTGSMSVLAICSDATGVCTALKRKRDPLQFHLQFYAGLAMPWLCCIFILHRSWSWFSLLFFSSLFHTVCGCKLSLIILAEHYWLKFFQ